MTLIDDGEFGARLGRAMSFEVGGRSLLLLRGELRAFAPACRVLFLLGVIVHRNSIAGACVACSRLGCNCFVGVAFVAERVAEERVDEMQDLGLAAEVDGEREAAGLFYLSREVAKDVRLRTAKAVDRLLEVADEEEAAGFEAGAADLLDEFDLKAVGVLKFVDEEQAEVVGQAPLAGRRCSGLWSRAWALANKSSKSSLPCVAFAFVVRRPRLSR